MNILPESTAPAFTDTGPFTIIPEWVLDADITPPAVRLYGVLGRYSDEKGVCWPSRRVLATRLKVSVDTVDRALRELTTLGAVHVEQRTGENGQRSNQYFVYRSMPHVRQGGRVDAQGGSRADAAGGGRVDAAQNESHAELEPVEREPLLSGAQDSREQELHHRLCKVCTGPRVPVATECLLVLLIAQEFFADHVIDECIGVCELLDIKPSFPRYLLKILQDRATETGQHIPDLMERFKDAGRSA